MKAETKEREVEPSRVSTDMDLQESKQPSGAGAGAGGGSAAADRAAAGVSGSSSAVRFGQRSQWKALMLKHVTGYKRNKDFVFQEIFNLVLYSVLLVVFAFTTSTSVTEAKFNTSITASGAISSADASMLGWLCNAGTVGFDGPPCYIAFGDQKTGTGCSVGLQEMVDAMPACAPGRNPAAYGNSTTVATCKCMPTGSFGDLATNIKNRVG